MDQIERTIQQGTVLSKRTSTSNLNKKKFKIIEAYASGAYSFVELAKKYKMKPRAVEELVNSHMKNLSNAKTVRSTQLPEHGGTAVPFAVKQAMAFKNILEKDEGNTEFLERLSESDAPELTEYEMSFVWHWLHGCSSSVALEKSGLAVGLLKPASNERKFENACKLRALYVRRKPNISMFLNDLKNDKMAKLKLGKVYVQEKLVKMIEELEDVKDLQARKLYLQVIDRVANTVNAYSHTVNVNDLRPADAIQKLKQLVVEDMEMTKIEENGEIEYVPEDADAS